VRKIKFYKGNFYHIYNRGVEKRNIFKNDNDRWRFLQGLFMFNDEKTTANLLWQLEKTRGGVTFGVLRDFLKMNSKKREPLVRISADCLMPNHFHLLIEEIKNGGISRFMHKLGVGYTKYFNSKYKRVGSLYQGTFKAAFINNEQYLKSLLVYINVINPGELLCGEIVKDFNFFKAQNSEAFCNQTGGLFISQNESQKLESPELTTIQETSFVNFWNRICFMPDYKLKSIKFMVKCLMPFSE